MTRTPPPHRDQFRHFVRIKPRWNDSDPFGHINNTVYYEYFDTAVVEFMTENGLNLLRNEGYLPVVVETMCRYHREIVFHDIIDIGLFVSRIGTTSVTYAIGVFANGESAPAASGHFVHVYVDPESRRPITIPPRVRRVLALLTETPSTSDTPETEACAR